MSEPGTTRWVLLIAVYSTRASNRFSPVRLYNQVNRMAITGPRTTYSTTASGRALRLAVAGSAAILAAQLLRDHGLALTAPHPAASGEDRTAGLAQAAEQLDRAVAGLRRAGMEDHLPLGFLARAALRRFRADFDEAAADLNEALEIAERGPMRLHECDAHLEWARLCRDEGDLAAARRHVARARELVNATGYGRREREVRWLEGVLGLQSGGNGGSRDAGS
jgi:hypothetical protein